MKSFKQFLNECYLSEEIPTGMSRDEYNRLPAQSRRKLSGSDAGLGRSRQTLTRQQTPLAVRGARRPVNTSQSWSHRNPGQLPIPNPPKPQGTTTNVPGSTFKPPTGSSGASSAAKEAEKTIAKNTAKNAGKGILRGAGKLIGPASAALDTALSTADERSKGSGWARSLAKGATVAAGGLLGATAGAIGGGGLLSAATGTAGALAGSAAAEKAFDTVAGANAVERKAMATANRKSQAGSSVKGIGGPTSFDTKKNTMTTGSGAQRKTVQLAKTGVVQRGGKSVAGDLAFKTDSKGQKQAVYKAPPAPGTGSTNPLENVGRALFKNAYVKHDAEMAAKKLATARQNDAARNKALGVKMKPGG